MLSLLSVVLASHQISVDTDQVRYQPGQQVSLSIRNLLHVRGRLSCRIYSQGRLFSTLPESQFSASDTRLKWTAPPFDERGYLVVATLRSTDGKTLDSASCGIDVSSRWTKFPRYGYLAHFGPELESRAADIIEGLSHYHINALQFYDYQWRHHHPLSPDKTWVDIGNRQTSANTVRAFIREAHKKGIACMAYNLGYGAVDGFEEDGYDPKWRLFEDPDHLKPYAFSMPPGWATKKLSFFDPANLGYQYRLFTEQKRAQEALGFDGWHMDQVGNPGPRFDGSGHPITLKDRFPSMLAGARRSVPGYLVFNNVGGYGLDETAKSPTDAMYIELWEWEGQKSYLDIHQLVNRARTSGKPVILTAYMNAKLGKAHSENKPGAFNQSSVLLTDATILASGATHLELGDALSMLHSEYFPDRKLSPSPELLKRLRTYYDFSIGYQNLLSAKAIVPLEIEALLHDVPTSKDGQKGTVWMFARSDGQRSIVHFINLLSAKSTDWRDTHGEQPPPSPIHQVKWHLPKGNWLHAFVMSPDDGIGAPKELSIINGEVTIPDLDYWTMIVLEPSK